MALNLPFNNNKQVEETRSFFDSRAEHWEETCYPEPVRVRLRDLIWEFEVNPGERLLDVGTGPGILIPYLRALAGETGYVCAFDLSRGMVRRACQKNYSPKDIILQANVHSIPFSRNVFDKVICFAAFPHFNDPEKAIQEMGRVLKPGGVLIIAHLMSREELARHHAEHSSVASHVLPDNPMMKTLFTKAHLSLPEIVDIPGRYMARAFKI